MVKGFVSFQQVITSESPATGTMERPFFSIYVLLSADQMSISPRLRFTMITTYACECGAADVQGVQRIFHNEDIVLYLAYLRSVRLTHDAMQ